MFVSFFTSRQKGGDILSEKERAVRVVRTFKVPGSVEYSSEGFTVEFNESRPDGLDRSAFARQLKADAETLISEFKADYLQV